MLRQPLEQLGNVLNIVQRSSASLNRIASLLQVVPDVRDREGLLVDLPLKGAVSVRGLSFRYPGTERDVLSDITFTVKPGRSLGIIGGMGSGKTTLADLLLRLYDPPEGTVFLDGRDIFSYPLARLREGIAYVPQDGFLFSTTILDNIGFADHYPDREWAERCSHIAAIHETLAALPEGFDTAIGERGVRLSGGQKQRIAIARMIYKDAPLQILDDSLSAVDTTTELRILKNLREREARTTIIISHRLSAVQQADEIIVLRDGRIAERGSHRTLMALGGMYADQWLLQSGEAEDDGDHHEPVSGYPEGELDALEAELTEDAA